MHFPTNNHYQKQINKTICTYVPKVRTKRETYNNANAKLSALGRAKAPVSSFPPAPLSAARPPQPTILAAHSSAYPAPCCPPRSLPPSLARRRSGAILGRIRLACRPRCRRRASLSGLLKAAASANPWCRRSFPRDRDARPPGPEGSGSSRKDTPYMSTLSRIDAARQDKTVASSHGMLRCESRACGFSKDPNIFNNRTARDLDSHTT